MMKISFNKEEKSFFNLLMKKVFSTFFFIFFSTVTASGLFNMGSLKFVLASSFIGAGLYLSSELIKYYGLQPERKVILKTYNFII